MGFWDGLLFDWNMGRHTIQTLDGEAIVSAYKLFWVLLKAIIRGHGKAPVYFDAEARKFDYHMACIGSAYCQLDHSESDEAWWITLHEERSTGGEG